MTRRLVDNDGDYTLTFSTGTEAIRQRLVARLQMFLGEWFLDTSSGAAWLQKVLIKPADIVKAESEIKRVILQTSGVVSLEALESDFDRSTRELPVSFTAITETGDVIEETV